MSRTLPHCSRYLSVQSSPPLHQELEFTELNPLLQVLKCKELSPTAPGTGVYRTLHHFSRYSSVHIFPLLQVLKCTELSPNAPGPKVYRTLPHFTKYSTVQHLVTLRQRPESRCCSLASLGSYSHLLTQCWVRSQTRHCSSQLLSITFYNSTVTSTDRYREVQRGTVRYRQVQ